MHINNEGGTIINQNKNVRGKPILHYIYSPSNLSMRETDDLLSVVEILLDAGADINGIDVSYNNRTLIMEAAERRHVRLLKLLINKGANTELKDKYGKNVFEQIDIDDNKYHDIWVIFTNLTEYGQSWLKTSEGKKWLKAWEIDNTTPIPCRPAEIYDVMDRAFSIKVGDEQKQVINWIESGGNINWSTDEGWTFLHFAGGCGNDQLIKYLIGRGANIEARSKNGLTPLMAICSEAFIQQKHIKALKTLIELGANVNTQNNYGYTALELVRRARSPERLKMGELLEQYGINTIIGKTSTCPECGSPETIQVIKRGIQVTLNGSYAVFSCPSCHEKINCSMYEIDKQKGVRVSCSLCNYVASIPSSVWCRTCGNSLSTGWQSKVK